MSQIVVIGSSNTDLITNVSRFPGPGETITGKAFMQAMGGKGANQAVAAKRLGGDVMFVTCLGADSNGRATLEYFREVGLDVSKAITVSHAPTGTAVILVNDEGENCIVVTPGANHELKPAHVQAIESELARASMVVLQMEIPYETVRASIELAAKHHVPVLLNVAPAREVDPTVLRQVDILVVNENEIERVSGLSIAQHGEEYLIDQVLLRGPKTVILTLGKKGCLAKTANERIVVPAFEVQAVDTTAAGDTFCGALATCLAAGQTLHDSLRFATAASAICVTKMGAQPSIPSRAETLAFLERASTNS